MVVDRAVLGAEAEAALSTPVIALPAWDPMGSLAAACTHCADAARL